MIINIRGTSGSGKSTLVKRYLDEHPNVPVAAQLGDWKKPKTVGYLCNTERSGIFTFIVGRYDTQCGGCDSLSYKGAHDDMERLIRDYAALGHNVIFEGLTVSSTLTRWKRVSESFPGKFWWAFMTTPEEECHRRILSRNGGREPKRKGSQNLADFQIKYRACMRHIIALRAEHEKVVEFAPEDDNYAVMCHLLR